MNIISTSKVLLTDLENALQQIPQAVYSTPIEALFGSTLGQHTRHIIEFFECLRDQYPKGTVNYDLRQRQMHIEQSPFNAIEAIKALKHWLSTPLEDCALNLLVDHACAEDQIANDAIKSSLKRELAYNIEHAIHHMAILKIGILITATKIELPKHFGIAPSTIRHQNNHKIGYASK